MITGLSIGIYLQQVLGADEAFREALGSGICSPLVVPDGSSNWPAVIYRRARLDSDGTKDGRGEDHVSVNFMVASDEYGEAVRCLEALREALEGRSGEAGGLTVMDAQVTGSDEAYNLDGGYYEEYLTIEFLTV